MTMVFTNILKAFFIFCKCLFGLLIKFLLFMSLLFYIHHLLLFQFLFTRFLIKHFILIFVLFLLSFLLFVKIYVKF